MHDDRRFVEERLNRAMAERIRPAVYAATAPLGLAAWPAPGEPVPVTDALAARYTPFLPGQQWGAPWSTTWFRAQGEVPAAWAGRRVEAVFDLGFVGDRPGDQGEALVYDETGKPIKGVAPRNQYVPVANPAAGGEQVSLLIEAAANPAAPVTVTGHVIDNDLARVELDEAGRLSSVRDLSTDRDVLAPDSCGNLLRLHKVTTVTDRADRDRPGGQPPCRHLYRGRLARG